MADGPSDTSTKASRLADEPFARASEDPHLLSPLGRLDGVAPPAPQWFQTAIDARHDRLHVTVEGAEIEYLLWGDPGRPGLLLLHGNGANADWWRFIAPFLSGSRRIAAVSWSGMGGSDHRADYSGDLYVREALAVADAAGLGSEFAVVGHSFGGMPAMLLAAHHPERISQAIIIDTPLGDNRRPPRRGDPQPHRIYPTMAEALARFRWAPLQPSPNLFITDFIARSSLKPVAGGWIWKFDPFLWHNFTIGDVDAPAGNVHVPLSFMWGDQSLLVESGIVQAIRQLLPDGTRFIGIPEAHHHVMADQPLALATALRALLA